MQDNEPISMMPSTAVQMVGTLATLLVMAHQCRPGWSCLVFLIIRGNGSNMSCVGENMLWLFRHSHDWQLIFLWERQEITSDICLDQKHPGSKCTIYPSHDCDVEIYLWRWPLKGMRCFKLFRVFRRGILWHLCILDGCWIATRT